MNVTVPFKWAANEKDTSIEEQMAPKHQTEASQKSVNGTMANDDAEESENESEQIDGTEVDMGEKAAMNNSTPTSTIDNTTSTIIIDNSTSISTVDNTTVKMESTTEKANFATTVELIKEETLKLVIFISTLL